MFVDEQVILATTALMCSVTAVMNLATFHRTAPTRFLPQEHYTIKTNLIQDINIPIPRGTDHTPPTVVTDMGDISTDHNPTAIPTMTGAAVSEDTHCAPHPATRAACSALLADGFPHHNLCCDTSKWHSCTPSCTHYFSHRCHSHYYSINQSWYSSSNSHDTAQEMQPRKAKPCPRPSTVPQIPPFQDCCHAGIPIRSFRQ